MEGARRTATQAGGLAPHEDALEHFARTHLDQRVTLAAIETLARGDPSRDRAEVARLSRETSRELELHLRDEEEDLFPLLRRRAGSDLSLEDMLARLSSEHARLAEVSGPVTEALHRLARSGGAPSAAERAAMLDFVAAKRRHVMFENAIVLPVARLWLTRKDRADLAARIAARHECARSAGGTEGARRG